MYPCQTVTVAIVTNPVHCWMKTHAQHAVRPCRPIRLSRSAPALSSLCTKHSAPIAGTLALYTGHPGFYSQTTNPLSYVLGQSWKPSYSNLKQSMASSFGALRHQLFNKQPLVWYDTIWPTEDVVKSQVDWAPSGAARVFKRQYLQFTKFNCNTPGREMWWNVHDRSIHDEAHLRFYVKHTSLPVNGSENVNVIQLLEEISNVDLKQLISTV
jgi:hypothetical protein